MMSRTPVIGTVLRRDERLRCIVWPDIKIVDVPDIRNGDCLLVCAGFEQRAVATLNRLCTSLDTGRTQRPTSYSVVLIRYFPEHVHNRIGELHSICRNAGLKLTEIEYNREAPPDMGEMLRHVIIGIIGDGRIYVDISGMSRLLIVQILVALLQEQDRMVSILYGEAEKYPPSRDKFQRDMESAGSGPAT